MQRVIAAMLMAVTTPALCGTASGTMSGRSASEPIILNEPSANWNVYGPGQTHKGRKDSAIQGGGAIRVTIPAKAANPWDIGASSPIKGAIAKGDRLVLAFWARLAEGGSAGRTTISGAIQQASPPYGAIVAGPVELTGEWKLVHIEGVAASDHPAGTANVALTLGSAAHTIDLGPVFVLKSA